MGHQSCPLCKGDREIPSLISGNTLGPEIDAERFEWAQRNKIPCPLCREREAVEKRDVTLIDTSPEGIERMKRALRAEDRNHEAKFRSAQDWDDALVKAIIKAGEVK